MSPLSSPPAGETSATQDSDAVYWDGVGAAWQERRPQRLWRRHSDAVNAALIARWLPQGARRVLETDLFGEAVSGGLAEVLGVRRSVLFGIDAAASTAVAAARRHPGLRAAIADVRRLPFADGSFDAVVSNSTLDHFHAVTDIAVSLAELARVLRPGGELILTLDNLANPVIRLRSLLPLAPLRATGVVPYHVGPTLGPRDTAAYLRTAGFEVLEMTSILHCPRVLAVPVAGAVERLAGRAVQDAYLRLLGCFESLAYLPSRHLTGHFVAAHARKPDHGG